MSAPINELLDAVEWTALDTDQPIPDGGMPYATHEGYLTFGGITLKCYTLNNGVRVFDADDLAALLSPPDDQPELDTPGGF